MSLPNGEQGVRPDFGISTGLWKSTLGKSEAMLLSMPGAAAMMYRDESRLHGYIEYASNEASSSSTNRVAFLFDSKGNPISRRILTGNGKPHITHFHPWGTSSITMYGKGAFTVDASLPENANENLWQEKLIRAFYSEGYLQRIRFNGDFGIKNVEPPIMDLQADMFILPEFNPSYFQDPRHENILYDHMIIEGVAVDQGVRCLMKDPKGKDAFEMSYQLSDQKVTPQTVTFVQKHLESDARCAISAPLYLDPEAILDVAQLDFFSDRGTRTVSDPNWSDISVFAPVEIDVRIPKKG